MQFNLVVSTNTAGIPLLEAQIGFRTIGTLPGAFRHRQRRYRGCLCDVRELLESPALHESCIKAGHEERCC